MAISISASGNTKMSSVGPGETASKSITVAGFTSASEVIVTPSHTASQTLQRNTAAQYTFQVVKGTGSFTVYANQKQTPDLYFDYAVFTGTA